MDHEQEQEQEQEQRDRVVQARRVELVDADGAIRGVLGELPTPDPRGEVFGLSLLTESGSPRVTLGVDADGGWVVLELEGNILVQLGVNEVDSDAVDARAVVHISDADGTPLIRWRVTDDGSLVEERW